MLAANAVTTAKIADDAVTGAKIEDNPTIAGQLSEAGKEYFKIVLSTDITGLRMYHPMSLIMHLMVLSNTIQSLSGMHQIMHMSLIVQLVYI